MTPALFQDLCLWIVAIAGAGWSALVVSLAVVWVVSARETVE